MQHATRLDVAVYRNGGDPDKPYVTVSAEISRGNALSDLSAEEREALLLGALEGMDAAMPETMDTSATLTFTETLSVVADVPDSEPIDA
ncbi:MULTISPECIES: hypothetical protein [unclassified Streptomyces]|uniref:hypothetical protein n=1 Tax=unclassified Streptomyces TaxID=2593676 RepID=UPI0035E1A2EB